MYEFAMVKLVILLLTGPFTAFDCSRYQCSSERCIFHLEIYGKWTRHSNQLESFMVLDRCEFDLPNFDCINNKLCL